MGVHLTYREAAKLGIKAPPAKKQRHDRLPGVLGAAASTLEKEFYSLIRSAPGLIERFGEPIHDQWLVDPSGDHQWRYDFAWPRWRFAVEIHGGQWSQGRHNRGKGLLEDLAKLRFASLSGWIVLCFTTDDLKKKRITLTLDDVEAGLRICKERGNGG